MDGVIQVYYDSLRRVQLSGPTIFQSVINQAAIVARNSENDDLPGKKYFVLCIITDGIINDMDATIHGIVEASSLPLSIVIVGVGDAEFTSMEHLDGDRQRLVSPSSGVRAARDMVQFVPFREFTGTSTSAQHALAKHVLAEIPGQFLSYMETKKIPPNARGAKMGGADVPAGFAQGGAPLSVPLPPQQQQQPPVHQPPNAYPGYFDAGSSGGSAPPETHSQADDDLPPPYRP
ncbi:unnamed protein product [Choristocarpus tenellus]